MKQPWISRVLPIAAIFSFRMLGLFLLIPVFTSYAHSLEGATPILIGIALGGYGLSQGLLQIPFGMLSDRLGRKPIICFGLILFTIGSLLGACTHSIYGMIFARILQGTGAIGSVLIALLSDITSDDNRTKSMAVIGMSIGLSFSLAMVLGPVIASSSGLSGIFYLTAMLALFGIALLYIAIPAPPRDPFNKNSTIRPEMFKQVLLNHHLQRLNAGIFFQHAILTASFYVIPKIIKEQLQVCALSASWHFYLPLITISFITMLPFIGLAERKQKVRPVFLVAIVLTAIAQSALSIAPQNWPAFCTMMFIYFVAFNLLEAMLPSLISKQSDPRTKGTAMGVYSSCQFLGIFVGGVLAGLLFKKYGYSGIFFTNSMLAFLWGAISWKIKPNDYLLTHKISYIPNKNMDDNIIPNLLNLPGVKDAVISTSEKYIYLSVLKNIYKNGSGEDVINAKKNTP